MNWRFILFAAALAFLAGLGLHFAKVFDHWLLLTCVAAVIAALAATTLSLNWRLGMLGLGIVGFGLSMILSPLATGILHSVVVVLLLAGVCVVVAGLVFDRRPLVRHPAKTAQRY